MTSITPPAPFNPNFALDAFATTLEAARANILASSTGQVALLNSDLKGRYLSLFNDYVKNVDTGRVSTDPKSPVYLAPPSPPFGYELAPANADGFVFYQVSKTPVCDMPELPIDRSQTQGQIMAALQKNVIDIGKHLQGAWYSLGAKDTFEIGKTTPPIPGPDGVLHTYEKFGGFAPGTGWYLQVS